MLQPPADKNEKAENPDRLYITVADGRTMPFCKRCYGGIARKQLRQRITGLLLGPFIEQEANNEQ